MGRVSDYCKHWGIIVASCLLLWRCQPLPLIATSIQVPLAQGVWFAEEQTLFVFYRFQSSEHLEASTLIELQYRSDAEQLEWTPLSQLTPVHGHQVVACGANFVCGSMSVQVSAWPWSADIRLRFHSDSLLGRSQRLAMYYVGAGLGGRSRSALVYGVFDESNTLIQWRLRHNFPNLANHEVAELGLKRWFTIEDGAALQPGFPHRLQAEQPYSYSRQDYCPMAHQLAEPTHHQLLGTSERALWSTAPIATELLAEPILCTRAVVQDGRGLFTTAAFARKNPEVSPAFPTLHQAIAPAATVPVWLQFCEQPLVEPHASMQRQRLLLAEPLTLCLEGWSSPGFAERMVASLRQAIDNKRRHGQDMVLVAGLHHQETTGALSATIEAIFNQVLQAERFSNTPRVLGGFVLDSIARSQVEHSSHDLLLWCPMRETPAGSLSQEPAGHLPTCPLMPSEETIDIGPFTFADLPILPDMERYQRFVERYGSKQTGQMVNRVFWAPQRSAVSATQARQERAASFITLDSQQHLDAKPTNVFSYCHSSADSVPPIYVRPLGSSALLPLAQLPNYHDTTPATSYALGLLWNFPFLLELNYQHAVGNSAKFMSLTVPFPALLIQQQDRVGFAPWQQRDISLAETLLVCRRFCTQPTFDSSGVYNLNMSFAEHYLAQCYRPLYPMPQAGGNPFDP